MTSTETHILQDSQFAATALQEIVQIAGNLSRQLLRLGSKESEFCRALWQIELRANYLLRTNFSQSPSQQDELRCRLQFLKQALGSLADQPQRPHG